MVFISIQNKGNSEIIFQLDFVFEIDPSLQLDEKDYNVTIEIMEMDANNTLRNHTKKL